MTITKRVLAAMALCLAMLMLCSCGTAATDTEAEQTEAPATTEAAEAPEATEAPAATETPAEETEQGEKGQITHYAEIDIADYGTITVALYGNDAPITVANFVKLVNQGFYNGLTFHRIMSGFMMQGGDPNGNGTGGSDETIKGEFSANGVENTLSHTRGAISMARSSAYDSASSQFFIMHQDYTGLDGMYAVFGYVTDGIDIVDAICTSAQPTDNNGTIPADEQPVINSITVREA